LGPRIEDEQSIRRPGGPLQLSSGHRDSFLMGGVALSLTSSKTPLEVRVLGLVGAAIRRTTRVGAQQLSFPTRSTPYEDTVNSVAPALAARLNLAVRTGGRISIVPSVAVHGVLEDDTPANQPPTRAVGSVLLSAAVGIAIDF